MSQLSIFTPKRKKSYHNTVPVQGKELVRRNSNALRQELEVLEVIKTEPKAEGNWTSWEMIQFFEAKGRTIPRSSIRRAMTNLMLEWEVLEKTNDLRDGEFKGTKNRAYKLIKK